MVLDCSVQKWETDFLKLGEWEKSEWYWHPKSHLMPKFHDFCTILINFQIPWFFHAWIFLAIFHVFQSLWEPCLMHFVIKCDVWLDKVDGWMSKGFTSLQQYFSHFETMEGWTWKALCNEAPFRFGKNLASSGIRTRDPVIRSRER